MKNSNALKIIAIGAGIFCRSSVFAHDGHGMGGAHWHATDSWGFMLVVAVAVWLCIGGPGGRK